MRMGVTPDAMLKPVVVLATTRGRRQTSVIGTEFGRIADKPPICGTIRAAADTRRNASPASEEAGDATSG
jgi:hypothetical protein